MNMYDKIQELCDLKGIKPAELSRKTGVPKSTLTDLKQGRSKSLSAQNISKIASFFGVAADYFYENTSKVDEIKDELFIKRKLLFDLSKRATEEQLDEFISTLGNMINEEDS